jgi:hypothetical protein
VNLGTDFEKTVGKAILGSFRLTKNYVLVCSGYGNDVYNNPKNKYYRLSSFSGQR